MTHHPRPRTLVTCVAALSLIALGGPALAQADGTQPGGEPADASPIQLERLDRGLVAVPTDGGIALTWRLLAGEATDATATSLTGPSFAVERDGVRIGEITEATNFLDPDGTPGDAYRLLTLVDGREVSAAETTAWENPYLDIPLTRPAGGVTPVGEAYTYHANDVSVGDLDGDGAYEYIVKWEPSNAKDVSQVGYTGRTYLDAYQLDGTLLWRIDMGVNIRSGAHYTQFPVMDFDGDGRAELMVKTAPGTTITRYDADGNVVSSAPVTMPVADVEAGYSHDDDYRLSAEDYYEHVVEMFLDWSQREEVTSGQWPATLEEAFGIDPVYDYPLSDADARALVDHFMDEYAPARSGNNRLRQFEGFVLSGPEYLTVVGGDGSELQTIEYTPERGDDGLLWGDYAMSRIEPGNRVDRFLAGAAYLDGERPSAVFARGYYTRTTLVAYDWDGEQLSERWYVDSGHAPLTNPFDDGPHGRDGTDPEYGTITTQGFHSLSFADVDDDGRHEVVYGSATLDDDGSLLYSSFDVMPEGSAAPGELARLGHGDAMHVTDIDPSRPGLEIFTVHEGGTWAPYGYALRDAATGEVLHGEYSGRDTGRGMIGDVRPDVPGLELWASMPSGADGSGLLSVTGEQLEVNTPGTNQSVRWAGDGTTQIINGSVDTGTGEPQPVTVDDWTRGTLLVLEGTATNNWTKGNPGLVADVLGDWREEVLVRTLDSSALRIYTSTEPTDRTMYTLMHDPQYRVEVARQQTTYNQPSYPGFYLASDTDFREVPVPVPADRAGLELTVAAELDDGNDDGLAGEGESIDYVYTLRNIGTVTLHDPVIEGGLSAAVVCDSDEIAPGAQVTCASSSAYVVTADDVAAGEVVNTVTAWAVAPTGVAAAAEVTQTVTTPAGEGDTGTPTPTPTPTPDPTDTATDGGDDPTPTPTADDQPTTPGGPLPDTGAAIGGFALAALLLVVGGVLLRRRLRGTA